MSVVVVGAGGHAAVCIDVLAAAGAEVRGVVDDRAPADDLPVPFLGDDVWLAHALTAGTAEAVFVAIGSNRRRAEVQRRLEALGARLVVAVHPSAVVSPTATLQPGAVVMPGAVVNARTRIGRGAIVNTAASVDHDGDIGDYTHIAPGSHLAGNVTTGEGAFLGVGASVVPGASIGAWATVGAGAAVVGDIAAGLTAVGVPARTRSLRAPEHLQKRGSGPLGEG
jgi:UDP-perosamine 4-acetyltransferase